MARQSSKWSHWIDRLLTIQALDASQAITGLRRRPGHNCDGRRRKYDFRAGNAVFAPAAAVQFPNNRNLAGICLTNKPTDRCAF
jgi:hypothetical protein